MVTFYAAAAGRLGMSVARQRSTKFSRWLAAALAGWGAVVLSLPVIRSRKRIG